VDSPHGGGKIPLMPTYLVSASDDCVILRNYEGMLVRYQAEDRDASIRPIAGNRGVSQLIEGTRTALMPENNERMARRKARKKPRAAKVEKNAESCCGSDTGKASTKMPKGLRTPVRQYVASLPVVTES
jgi:hypothetical protein